MLPTARDIQTYLLSNEACRAAVTHALSISDGAYDAITVAPLGAGEHNINFVASTTGCDGASAGSSDGGSPLFVIRINIVSQLGLKSQIAYEYSVLSALQHCGKTPRPLYLDVDKGVNGYDVLVEDYLAGEWLDFENDAHLDQVARTLAAIHTLDPFASGGTSIASVEALNRLPKSVVPLPLFQPTDPLYEQLLECRHLIDEYQTSGFATPSHLATLEALFAQTAAAVETAKLGDHPASIINTEAVPSHFLISSIGKNFDLNCDGDSAGSSSSDFGAASLANTASQLWCSMVDWEKAIIGNPAQDLAYFLSPTSTIWDTEFIFDRASRERFIERYCAYLASGEHLLDEIPGAGTALPKDLQHATSPRLDGNLVVEALGVYAKTNALRGLTWSARTYAQYQNPNHPLRNEKTRAKLDIYQDASFIDICRDLIW